VLNQIGGDDDLLVGMCASFTKKAIDDLEKKRIPCRRHETRACDCA
jgi:hypothetical protein